MVHGGRSGFFKDCAIIETSEDGDTITTVITFEEDCEDFNGNVITGTITKVETVTDISSENSITIEDLSINGYVINGTKNFTYTTSNENGNPQMSGSVDISVETDEGTVSKSGSRTVEITAGGDTDDWSDNEKTVTGSFTFTNTEGETYSMEITTPLVKPAGCRFFASGVKTYTTSEGTAALDFGDGTCDDIATFTDFDGEVSEVTLGRKRWHKNDDDDDDDEGDDEDGIFEEGTEVTVQNTFQSVAFDVVDETPFGDPATSTISDDVEFVGFLGIYDIEFTEDTITFSITDGAAENEDVSALFRTIEEGTFDRYYFSFDDDIEVEEFESSDEAVSASLTEDGEMKIEIGEGYEFGAESEFTIYLD